jgi:hypothetical protein
MSGPLNKYGENLKYGENFAFVSNEVSHRGKWELLQWVGCSGLRDAGE